MITIFTFHNYIRSYGTRVGISGTTAKGPGCDEGTNCTFVTSGTFRGSSADAHPCGKENGHQQDNCWRFFLYIANALKRAPNLVKCNIAIFHVVGISIIPPDLKDADK